MANSIPSNPGFKAGGAAGNTALLLEIFGGEIQAAYERMTIMRDKHRIFKLENGKTLRFPRVGRATASYHTPGTEILGKQIDHDEIVLSSDDKLISDVFVADIHEILNHFDVRGEYTRQLAEALAVQFDQNVMRAVIKAARTNDLLGGPVAKPVQVAGLDTDVTKLFAAVSTAKQTLDENFVRVDQVPVYALFKTAAWYLMAQSDKNLNRDYNGGDASIRNHTLTTIDGVQILKSNLCPWVNDSANSNIPTRYRQNMATTVGAVWTPDAVATAEVQAMSVQTEEQISKQGTLILARQMSGSDTFRASNAVELRTGAPA
ncbi:phage capsid protein [Brevundimonas diminuta]|uniref:phage capsid protein n=1 Tax=Brevundimonas diminuta TaxID=293 RepID=UPI001F599A52|nr:phage capsid protein [Brevundimonas diminuta]